MPDILIFLLLVIMCIVVGLAILHYAFKAPRLMLDQTPTDYDLDFESHRVPTVAGKSLHVWWVDAIDAEKTVVLLHGWGSSASQLLPLALLFHASGYNVCMLDARNHGQSDGHGFSSLPRFAEDTESVLDWIKQAKPIKCRTLVLVGHSLGAGACLLVASRRNEISAVVSLAAFSHPEFVMRRFLTRWPIPESLILLVLKYVQWVIGFRFDHIAPVTSIGKIKSPVLLVHGDADTTVPLDQAKLIYAASDKSRCELLVVPDAAHDSIDKLEDHGREITAFLERVLSPAAER